MSYLAVAVGGALGAVLRYAVSGLVQGSGGDGFPLGTLVVNVAGSFIIGLALELGTDRFLISPEARLFITTGLCGGLTTFSTFSYETMRLVEEQQYTAAAGNIGLSLALCLGAVFLGFMAGRAV
ncbi:MAG: fluoride efflux transporter CrcB [Deltaproteobacteria bacterium]|nr:fluoride efflux transporter CrcB [Deltaproteobacteria bacterium]